MAEIKQTQALVVEFDAKIPNCRILSDDYSSILQTITRDVLSKLEFQNDLANSKQAGSNKLFEMAGGPASLAELARPDFWIVMSATIQHGLPDWRLKILLSVNLMLPTFVVTTMEIGQALENAISLKKSNIRTVLTGAVDEALRKLEQNSALVEGEIWKWSASDPKFKESSDYHNARMLVADLGQSTVLWSDEIMEAHVGTLDNEGRFLFEIQSFNGNSASFEMQDVLQQTGQFLRPVSDILKNLDQMPVADAVELIKDWVLANFEDPAHSMPYDGRDGGYQYLRGGPFYTDEIIAEHFADQAPNAAVNAAIELLNGICYFWVPSERREIAPQQEDELRQTLSGEDRLAETMSRVERLEQDVGRLRQELVGLGDNNPPEPIEDIPLNQQDLNDIEMSLATVKSDAASVISGQTTKQQNSRFQAATSVLKGKWDRLNDWLIKQGKAISDDVKTQGRRELVKAIGRSLLWLWTCFRNSG